MRPGKFRLDRMPNPHLGFGSGHHNCLGAAHAHTVLRSLIAQLGARTSAITVIEAERNIERYGNITRAVGYRHLKVALAPKALPV